MFQSGNFLKFYNFDFWHINFEKYPAQKQIEWKFSMCRACQNWKLSKNKTAAAETQEKRICLCVCVWFDVEKNGKIRGQIENF